jgi:hypothetical protein
VVYIELTTLAFGKDASYVLQPGVLDKLMRTAEETISQAIKENRFPEFLLYAFAIIFVVTGEVLIWSAIEHDHALGAIGGVGLNGLAWPAFAQTRELRRENLMLRMLEIPLSKAQTADEAAKMLTDAFRNLFKRSEERKPKTPTKQAQA